MFGVNGEPIEASPSHEARGHHASKRKPSTNRRLARFEFLLDGVDPHCHSLDDMAYSSGNGSVSSGNTSVGSPAFRINSPSLRSAAKRKLAICCSVMLS